MKCLFLFEQSCCLSKSSVCSVAVVFVVCCCSLLFRKAVPLSCFFFQAPCVLLNAAEILHHNGKAGSCLHLAFALAMHLCPPACVSVSVFFFWLCVCTCECMIRVLC